jgi:hypothetical protein
MVDTIALADAVAAVINSGTFSVPVTAHRLLLPEFELSDLAELKVTVVPRSVEMTPLSRKAMVYEVEIDIGIQKKLAGEIDTELPGLLTLVEEINVFLRKRTLSDAVWIKSSIDPIYAREHLSQSRVFTSVLTITYKLVSEDS